MHYESLCDLVMFADCSLLELIARPTWLTFVHLPRCCALQADSEELKQAWISAVQGSIDLAYREKVESQQLQVTISEMY